MLGSDAANPVILATAFMEKLVAALPSELMSCGMRLSIIEAPPSPPRLYLETNSSIFRAAFSSPGLMLCAYSLGIFE